MLLFVFKSALNHCLTGVRENAGFCRSPRLFSDLDGFDSSSILQFDESCLLSKFLELRKEPQQRLLSQ